ncbi:hypothetical protein KUTeg_003178 [Tegillarca granosa]|uniref:PKD domain-containing protein n=1 Tax=Tegillarca granosa TaxID=220873 RepID=A0ABQ9FQ87_TEGGR|nr:hypothetical protein KUTeg_003178 [Tegillarca granosa]
MSPQNYASCYYNVESMSYSSVFYSLQSTSQSSISACSSYCFTQGTSITHAVYISSSTVCMCGAPDNTKDCICIGSSYSDGDVVTCTGVSYMYASGVYEVSTGLIFDPVPTLQVGTSHSFTARTTLSAIDQYQWSFGDSSFVEFKTTTNSYYTMTHTYAIPGTFTLTVTVCSTSPSVCKNGSIPVIVQLDGSDISATLNCDSYVDVTSKVALNATFRQGYQTEYLWSRSPSFDYMAKHW